jgi:hypothetical protein
MGISFTAIGSMSVGGIRIIIVIGRTTISAMSVSRTIAGVSRTAISAMNIGSTSAGIRCAAIGTWSHIDRRWGSFINYSGRGRSNYHHTLTKIPGAGRQ